MDADKLIENLTYIGGVVGKWKEFSRKVEHEAENLARALDGATPSSIEKQEGELRYIEDALEDIKALNEKFSALLEYGEQACKNTPEVYSSLEVLSGDAEGLMVAYSRLPSRLAELTKKLSNFDRPLV